MWLCKQVLRLPFIKKEVQLNIRHESIAYHNWVHNLHTTGFPRNEKGNMMNSWELHDYYITKSGKQHIYVKHSKDYDGKFN